MASIDTYNADYDTASWHLTPTADELNVMELMEGGAPVTLSLTISNAPTGFELSKSGGTGAHTGEVNVGTNNNGIRVDHSGGLVESMSVDSSTWNNTRFLVITPTEDDDFDNEVYAFTIGYTPSSSADIEAWVTLRQLRGQTAIDFVEEVAITIRVTDTTPSDFGFREPTGSTPEGEWAELALSLIGPERGSAATLQVSSTAPGFETNRDSDTVVIDDGDYGEYAISIRIVNDIATGDIDRDVVITDLGTMVERNFAFRNVDDDMRGLAIAGVSDNNLGGVQLGRERNLNVRLTSEPGNGYVEVTVGHTEEVSTMVDGTSVPITVSVMPLALTFNAGGDTWEMGLPLTLTASTDSTLAVSLDYTVTLGVDTGETTETYYRGQPPSPITLSMVLQSFGFLEFGDLAGDINEGEPVAIRFSLPEARETATRLGFSSDTALPDSGVLRFTPSEDVIPANTTSERVVMVTYDDDISNVNDAVINVVVTNLDDMAETTSYPLTFMDDDTAGLRVGGELVTGGMASLGELRINRSEGIDVRLNTRPTVAVTVNVDFATEVGDPDAVTVEIRPVALTFTTDNWDSVQTFALSASTASTMALSIDYSVTLGIYTTDGMYSTIAVTLDAILESSLFGEEDVESVKAAVAVVDLGAAQFALDAIGGNFTGGGAQPQLAPSLNLGGASGSAIADPADPWALDDNWRDDFVSLLDGGSFRLPLSGSESGGGFEVWGEGRALAVSGDNGLEDGSTYEYDGDANGFVLGFGRRGAGLGYGVAVAQTNSRVDLVGDSLSVDRVDNDVLTLLPYVGVSFDARSRAWLVGGYGEGEAQLSMADDVMEADSSVRSLGVGIEHSMDMGGFDLAGRLLASSSQSTLDGNDDLPDLNNVKGSAHRVRAEVEAERNVDMFGTGNGTVFGVAALRGDGGDVGGSFGLEFGGGLRAQMMNGYSIELEGRQQANPSSHRESSLRVRVGYDAGYDGRGLGVGLDEAGGATVGYGWGRSVLGHRGVLSLAVGRDGHGEVATTKLGFVSQGLHMSVAGDDEELRADFDLIVLGR